MSGRDGGGDGSLIATTRNAELQPLGTGGQLAVQAWDQITGYLRRSRGPAHAALLAEPNPDPDRGITDWYADSVGDAPVLDSLPQPQRDAARAEFTRLFNDIREDGDKLRRSTRENERFLGELLALALVTPATDNLRVVGTQPVLVAWGHAKPGEPPAPELLIGMLAGRSTAAAAPGLGPMRILGPPPVVRQRSWRGWMAATLTLLPLGLFLLLLWLDPFRWFEAPPQQCIVQPANFALLDALRTEQAREGQLRAEIAGLAMGLGDRRVACPPPPAQAAPVPPPAPPPRSADAERAREQGGRNGVIQIILAWDDVNDLDLAILCPGGQRIFFSNTRACGGELDVDQNSGRPLVPQPVENVVFATEPAPGRYRILVTNFKHNPPAPALSPYRVTLRRQGLPDQVFTGQVAPERTVEVGSFDSPVR